ncbi:hypothetical protein BH23ACT9_BH23ACT9_17930 [soil metagenome]
MTDVIVVGAGLAGLLAARQLVAAGADVAVVDKGRSPGGRLATRRLPGEGVADHGAQFFTVRSEDFAAVMADWPVHVWHHGPGRAGAVTDDPRTLEAGGDGHPRWVGRTGMNGIAKHLAQGLAITTSVQVTGVEPGADGWTVRVRDGDPLQAARVLLTAPVPQGLALLSPDVAAGVPAGVVDLGYEPCVGLLAVLDAPPRFGEHRAVQFDSGPVRFLADNATKGISAAPAITVHADGDWSTAHFDDADEDVARDLAELVDPWVGSGITDAQVKRWRYATPLTAHEDRAVTLAEGLVIAGDAFGGPKVEGAALSGLAAAALLA